jgi:hypothetical protein
MLHSSELFDLGTKFVSQFSEAINLDYLGEKRFRIGYSLGLGLGHGSHLGSKRDTFLQEKDQNPVDLRVSTDR